MKKLSLKEKLRSIAYAKKSMIKKTRSNRLLKQQRYKTNKRAIFRENRSIINVPEQICYSLDKQRRVLLSCFFNQVEQLLKSHSKVVLNFNKTKKLYPCGVLLFLEKIDEWVEEYPNKITGTYPADELVEQMLQRLEILEKVGLPPRRVISHTDVTRWHYFTGMKVDASQVEPFMIEVRALVGEEEQMKLADCINEAMTNVRHHAYDVRLEGRWWIFAQINENGVFVALHDRGATIPRTLLEKPAVMDYLTGKVWQMGRADGKLIAAAVGGRTSTQLPYRGKGLPEMLQFTQSATNGELAIYSRKGFFKYASRMSFETVGKLTHPIDGTLIIWMIKLAN